ncbi:MAG: helix-turn-helix domain-containing protein [Desulfomonilaceae bacterium]
MTDKSSFWNRVESKRLPGESLAAFARRFGIPASSLRAYQKGSRSPRISSCKRLASKLGVWVGWLAFGESRSLAEMKQEAQRRGIDISELPYSEEPSFPESQGTYLQ